MSEINWMAARTEVTLSAKQYENKKSNYLFYNSSERILNLCDQYTSLKKDDFKNESNKSISIVGERGSGKTSVVKTVSNKLKEKNYFVFNIVDPGVFSSSMSLLELFISNIYLHIDKENNEANSYDWFSKSDKKEILRLRITEEIEEIMDTLANFRISKSVFSNENTSMEVLNDINNRVSFCSKLSKLIANFREYTGKENLVLCIDDLDLVYNNEIYNMLEDIRKYLIKDLIVIVSYRDVQLLDAIVQKNLTENKVLNDKGFVDKVEIYNQSTKYIEKLFPLSSRVYLKKSNEVWNQKASNILNALLDADDLYKDEFVEKYVSFINDDENKEKTRNFLLTATVKEWLTFAIFKKTRMNIEPVDAKEEMIVGLPDNMRGLLQLIEIVHERLVMPDNTDENTYLKIIRENLKIYKEYYYDFISEKLSTDEMKIIRKWEESPVNSKNYYIYQALFHKMETAIVKANNEIKAIKSMDQLLNINLVSNENVTVGDVYEILERYKMTNANDPESVFFIYIMKVVYSIELLQLYINGGNTDEKDAIKPYLTLLNHKITPDTLIYIEKSNNIFKYNKNFINVGIEMINKANLIHNNNYLFKDQINNLIDNITYTTYTTRGENNRNNRIKLGVANKDIKNEDILQTRNITYAYRKYFNKGDKKADLINNSYYYFDLLMLITNKDYVESSFKQKKYVYYSLFDMDRLLRINFGGGNNSYTLHSVVNQIEKLFNFSNKENNVTYLYEDIQDNKSKKIFNEYEVNIWYLFDLLLENRQELVENFEKINKTEVENDAILLSRYKKIENDLYSISKHIDSSSLANEINELGNDITSNIVLIPNSKKGLKEAILDVLEKENDLFDNNEINELKHIVANTKSKGSLNKQDKNRFKQILDKKEIRNELK